MCRHAKVRDDRSNLRGDNGDFPIFTARRNARIASAVL